MKGYKKYGGDVCHNRHRNVTGITSKLDKLLIFVHSMPQIIYSKVLYHIFWNMQGEIKKVVQTRVTQHIYYITYRCENQEVLTKKYTQYTKFSVLHKNI